MPRIYATAPRYQLVLISPRFEDHESLRSILRDSPWEMRGTRTGSAGLDMIRRNPGATPVVICEHSIPEGWRHLLAELGRMEARPSLIMCSRLADERLWAEVLNLGAFDLLLGAPFDAEEVLRVTQGAWWAWDRAVGASSVPRIGPGLARGLDKTRAKALTAGSYL